VNQPRNRGLLVTSVLGPSLLVVLGIVTLILRVTIDPDPVRRHDDTITLLVLFVGTVILVAAIVALLRVRGVARDRAVLRLHPGALLVLATRSEDFARYMSLVGAGTRIGSVFVWAIDEAGATAYKGGGRPVAAMRLAWPDIQAVTRVEARAGQRHLPAIAFTVLSKGGRARSLPFAVRGTGSRIFPFRAAMVDRVWEQIMARAPAGWNASQLGRSVDEG
jgi:hypothetical protein